MQEKAIVTEQNGFLLDFTNVEDVLKAYRSKPLLSSEKKHWNRLHFDYYRHPPHQLPEIVSKQHLIIVQTDASVQAEQLFDGQFQKDHLKVGDVLIVPAYTSHQAQWDAEHGYIVLSLEPEVFKRHAQMVLDVDTVELIPRFATPDPLIHSIGMALKTEFELNHVEERFYTDSLIDTLLSHLLRHYSDRDRKLILPSRASGLSHPQLHQVVEYVQEHLDQDLTLTELAAVVRMSSNYFASLFKQSMGLTPHQYVVQQRVERAKQLLRQGKLSISEIATRSGFAHQSHLNRHFKRVVGVTPKHFLKSA